MLLALAGPAAGEAALELPAPANKTFSVLREGGSYTLAIGPWAGGQVEMLHVNGAISVESWRLPGRGGETGALMARLAEQARAAGYEILYQCAQDQCGGFDFRFSLDIVPEPDMHVDLGNYQYLAARMQTPQGPEFLSLMVSASPGAGFVQIARVYPADGTGAPADSATLTSTMTEPEGEIAPPPPRAALTLAEQLEQNGYAVLADLTFRSGSSELGAGPFPSLEALARYLRDNPGRSVALVGHSDAKGSLAVNVALSERRALAVRERLVERYAIAPAQLDAKGVGYLAPIDSNLTEQGRSRNRRVEAVLTSTE